MKGKLKPSMEVALHFNCLALHFAFAVVPLHDLHDPRHLGLSNEGGHSVLRNLWAELIGLPDASYVTNVSSISRAMSSNR